MDAETKTNGRVVPWNKGKLLGQKLAAELVKLNRPRSQAPRVVEADRPRCGAADGALRPERPGLSTHIKNIQAAANDIGLAVSSLTMRQAEDLAPLFATNAGKSLGSMYPLTSNTIFRLWPQIGDFALANRLPTPCEFRQMVQSGRLLSYGRSLDDITERCAALIDKILRGTPPGELPIERPTRFELAVNLKTANALGVTVPQSILLRADELIQ